MTYIHLYQHRHGQLSVLYSGEVYIFVLQQQRKQDNSAAHYLHCAVRVLPCLLTTMVGPASARFAGILEIVCGGGSSRAHRFPWVKLAPVRGQAKIWGHKCCKLAGEVFLCARGCLSRLSPRSLCNQSTHAHPLQHWKAHLLSCLHPCRVSLVRGCTSTQRLRHMGMPTQATCKRNLPVDMIYSEAVKPLPELRGLPVQGCQAITVHLPCTSHLHHKGR